LRKRGREKKGTRKRRKRGRIYLISEKKEKGDEEKGDGFI
jgi:hypothetical protein